MRRSLLCVYIAFFLSTASVSAEELQLSLAECLERALSSSLEIREGRFRPAIAETSVTEAEAEFDYLLSFRVAGGRAHVPVGSALAGATELLQQTFAAETAFGRKLLSGGTVALGYSTDDLLTNSSFYTVRPQWTNALSFRVDHPILRGAGEEVNSATTRIAMTDLAGASHDYRGIVQQTLTAVERAYWNLVFLRDDLDVKRRSLEVARELLRVSDKRLAAGAGTRVEVIQAQAGEAAREKELILADHFVRNAEDGLRAYLFPFTETPDREIRIIPRDRATAPSGPPAPIDVKERIRTAFEHRPDLLAVRERLEADGIRVVRAENELLPRLDFFGSVGLSELNDDFFDSSRKLLRADFPAWTIGISLELPIGNRAARARHSRALLERARSIAAYESIRNRAVIEVRAAVRGVDTAHREIVATRRAVEAAEAQFRAEEDRVAADKSTNYQLLQVEQDLTTAKSQELLARVGLRRALVDLEEATGTYLSARGLVAPAAAVAESPEAAGAGAGAASE